MGDRIEKKKFRISLSENGVHSLKKGVSDFKQYQENDDLWKLKESILFFHNGIELLMKQILIQQSEYLIFEDLNTVTIKKIKQAQIKDISVFNLPKSPKTISYLDAIRRVEVIIKPQELTQALISHLESLNNLRNSIEHYAIDDLLEVPEKLLHQIEKPIIELFKKHISEFKTDISLIQDEWASVSNNILLRYIITSETPVSKSMIIEEFIGDNTSNMEFWEFQKEKNGIEVELEKLLDRGILEFRNGNYYSRDEINA